MRLIHRSYNKGVQRAKAIIYGEIDKQTKNNKKNII